MNATTLRRSLEEKKLPEDLNRIVEERSLMRMAFEAIDATPWPRPLSSTTPRMPEPALRTLTAFCYSTGVFSSEEIATLSRRDANIRYLCANDFPTREEVRLFRRRNLPYLRETLARMIYEVCVESEWAPDASFFTCLAEADRRLTQAMEADSAAMDGE